MPYLITYLDNEIRKTAFVPSKRVRENMKRDFLVISIKRVLRTSKGFWVVTH